MLFLNAKRAKILCSGVALFSAERVFAVTATITTYNTAAAWDAAVGNTYVTEPFNSTGLQPFTGVNTSTGSIGTARGVLTGSVWTDRVVEGGTPTIFTYLPGQVEGAGATWDTSPGGEGQGLLILDLVGGGTQTISQIGPIDGAFFGWTSNIPFSSFEIEGGSNAGVAETFDMDNLQFATASSVPEPVSATLLGAAAIGLLSRSRRRTRVTALD